MKRPAGVTVVAIAYIVGACFLVLMAFAVMIGGSFAGGALGSVMGGSQTGTGTAGGAAAGFVVGLAGGILVLLLAAAHGVLAWGMLKLKEWARIISIALAAIGVVGGILGLLLGVVSFTPGRIVWSIIRLGIAAVILWYLVQPHVKAAFRRDTTVPVQV